jgi:hypothetical protein
VDESSINGGSISMLGLAEDSASFSDERSGKSNIPGSRDFWL